MSSEQHYQGHTIRIQPHKEYCSEYAFVIIDPNGKEIKHVSNGGDTQKRAFERAKEMIDFEFLLHEEKT